MTCNDNVSWRIGGLEDLRILGGRSDLKRKNLKSQKIGGLWCQIKAE